MMSHGDPMLHSAGKLISANVGSRCSRELNLLTHCWRIVFLFWLPSTSPNGGHCSASLESFMEFYIDEPNSLLL